MIKCRFITKEKDYRPISWPIKHPYWYIGYDSNDCAIIVAYADNLEEIMKNWPEAEEIDYENEQEYCFNSRFPKPDWFIEK